VPTWFEAYQEFGRRYWTDALASSISVRTTARISRSNRTDVYKNLHRFNVPLPPHPRRLTWQEAYEQFGREYWTALMAACGANVTAMGRASASNRQDMYKKLKRFKVKLPVDGRHYGGHRGNWGTLSNEEP
jgi:hypothetical protein